MATKGDGRNVIVDHKSQNLLSQAPLSVFEMACAGQRWLRAAAYHSISADAIFVGVTLMRQTK